MKNGLLIKSRRRGIDEDLDPFYVGQLFGNLVHINGNNVNLLQNFSKADQVFCSLTPDQKQFHNQENCALLFQFADGTEKKFWFWEGEPVSVSSQEEFERWLKLRSFE